MLMMNSVNCVIDRVLIYIYKETPLIYFLNCIQTICGLTFESLGFDESDTQFTSYHVIKQGVVQSTHTERCAGRRQIRGVFIIERIRHTKEIIMKKKPLCRHLSMFDIK